MKRLPRNDDMEDLFGQMERVFDQLQQKGMNVATGIKGGMPVDIQEEDGKYLVKADLPGVHKDNLSVKADETGVEIAGESEEEVQEQNEKYFRKERRSKSFNRRVNFPTEVDPETVTAEYEDGVLTLEAEKTEEDGKEVDIK